MFSTYCHRPAQPRLTISATVKEKRRKERRGLILKTLLAAEWNPCLALGLDWAHLRLKGAILIAICIALGQIWHDGQVLIFWGRIMVSISIYNIFYVWQVLFKKNSYTLPLIGFASLDQRPLNWAFDVAILESERNSFHYHFQTSKSSDCVQLGDISSWHDTFHVTFQCVTDWWAKLQNINCQVLQHL